MKRIGRGFVVFIFYRLDGRRIRRDRFGALSSGSPEKLFRWGSETFRLQFISFGECKKTGDGEISPTFESGTRLWLNHFRESAGHCQEFSKLKFSTTLPGFTVNARKWEEKYFFDLLRVHFPVCSSRFFFFLFFLKFPIFKSNKQRSRSVWRFWSNSSFNRKQFLSFLSSVFCPCYKSLLRLDYFSSRASCSSWFVSFTVIGNPCGSQIHSINPTPEALLGTFPLLFSPANSSATFSPPSGAD